MVIAMDKGATLSLAFIERHPRSAARTLSAVDPSDAAAYLDTVPTRYGVIVLSKLASWPSALIMARMDLEAASALLKELPFLDASAILRLVPAERQAVLLDTLPTKLRTRLEASLSYPADAVGACMTPEIIEMRETNSVGDAIILVQRAPRGSPFQIFVVGEDRSLRGMADVSDLLRSQDNTLVGEIMRPAPATISARARIESVKNLPAWDDMIHLPVLSRGRKLIGALSRKAVFREDHGVRSNPAHASIAGSMIEEFLSAGAGLGRLLLDAGVSEADAEAMEA
jgi:magnesium transporter